MLQALKGLLSSSKSQNSSIPVTSGPGVCVNCKIRPQAWDQTRGQYYLFCSRACAAPKTSPGTQTGPNIGGGPSTRAGGNANVNTVPTPAPSLCIHCNKKPQYDDGTTVYPYCGRTCAKLAKGNGSANVNPPVPTNPFNTPNSNTTTPANGSNPLASGSTKSRRLLTSRNVPPSLHPRNASTSTTSTNTLKSTRSSVLRTTSSGPTCQTPGCSASVYVDPSGATSNYCTKTHRQAPRNGAIIFCAPCHNRVLLTAPIIFEVPEDHDNYKSVASQFRQKWMHKTQCPEVRAVYKIVTPTANLASYEQYLSVSSLSAST